MSTALRVLPAVAADRPGRLFLAATASPTSIAAAAGAVHQRKGPHALRLVQACAEPQVEQGAVFAKVVQMPLRVQPDLAIYRPYTEAMLRRYLTMSMEAAHTPSLLGQEMFRGRVSNCKVTGFDDVVIFVEDVSKCLAQLTAGQGLLIRRIAIEGYSHVETAATHGIALKTVFRRYHEAIDRLTRIFLDRELMHPMQDA